MIDKPWFRQIGWIYRPTSWRGWVFTILIAAFCWNVIAEVHQRTHSSSDLFYGVFPYLVPALGIWEFVARKTSGSPREDVK